MDKKARTWMKVGVIAGIVAALAALGALVIAPAVNNSRQGARGSQNVCGAAGTGNKVTCSYLGQAQSAEKTNEAEVLRQSRQSAGIPPKGTGPWPFIVVRTLGLGLKVRTTPTVEGVQIGTLSQLQTAWAVCKENSGFDPDPATGNGPIWLKIKWDHPQPGKDYRESDYGAKGTAWAYAGYAVPVGHNGEIPSC